jgi:Rps23 Pro-64 3,4-dihydroxylase Tpa1-like proline 4-hydroxylase
MAVTIVEDFLNKDLVASLKSGYLDKLTLDPKTGHFKSADLTQESEETIRLIKDRVSKAYDIEIPGHQFSVIKMLEGAYNGIHEDTSDYTFDGLWADEVGISALLYLSEHGKDFTGGALVFPQHDIRYEPKAGSLVFFRGDNKHRHGVETVLSGERTVLVLFF